MKVLGIDPGTATTGYGIVEQPARKDLLAVEFGCITTAKHKPLPVRLLEIYTDLEKIIKRYRPQKAAVESVYFFKNTKTAIAVAQARGVVILCLTKNNIPILELTPLQVKQGLTGYGQADKKQIQFMVKNILRLKHIPKPDDAADALALAICAAGNKFTDQS